MLSELLLVIWRGVKLFSPGRPACLCYQGIAGAQSGKLMCVLLKMLLQATRTRRGEDNRNVARMAALLAGLPVSVAGNTVTGSAPPDYKLSWTRRELSVVVRAHLYCSGVESMTRAPFVMGKIVATILTGILKSLISTIGWRFIK